MVLEEMDTRNLPATSLEDFWDIWFDLGLGNQAGMETTFAAHSVDYVADAQEPNDRPEDATLLTVGGGFQENTFYDTDANHGGDEDWFRFTAVANTHHRIEISGAVNTIFGRPNPEMFLLDVTGEQVLARSDDPYDTSLNIQSSSTAQDMDETVPSILWRAPSSGDFYVYVRHESGALNKGQRYGTYQIQVTNAGSPTPTIDQVLAQTMLPGQSYHVTIQGSNFATGTTVTTSDAGITASEVNWRSPEMLDVVLDVGGGVANGTDTLTVSNPGAGSAVSGAVLTTSSSAQPPVAISEVGLGIDAVELINLGTVAANLTGWEIRGRTTGASLDYTLPSFSLPAGATVVVHEGSGTDTATELYASVNFPWVNGGTGDVSLLDASDNAVDYIRFSSGYVTTHLTPQGTGGLWMQPEFQSPPFGTVSRSFDRVRPRTRDGIDGALSTIPNGGGAGRINALDAHEPNGGPRLVEVLMRSDSVLDLEISPAPAGTDEDWFGILVRAGDEVRISALFGDAAGDLDMELYAPGEESTPFASATSSTDDEEIIVSPATTTSLGGGIYRLRVFGFSGATNSYSLMTQPVPAELTVFTAEP
jgi:hypothetical protein